jgi:hypothetical protein
MTVENEFEVAPFWTRITTRYPEPGKSEDFLSGLPAGGDRDREVHFKPMLWLLYQALFDLPIAKRREFTMKLSFSRFFCGSKGGSRAEGRSYRPQLETLERREVASATSWFDNYHAALVSATGQERRADHVAFAINDHHDLIATDGKAAVDVSKFSGDLKHGYAQDICA